MTYRPWNSMASQRQSTIGVEVVRGPVVFQPTACRWLSTDPSVTGAGIGWLRDAALTPPSPDRSHGINPADGRSFFATRERLSDRSRPASSAAAATSIRPQFAAFQHHGSPRSALETRIAIRLNPHSFTSQADIKNPVLRHTESKQHEKNNADQCVAIRRKPDCDSRGRTTRRALR